MRWRWGRRPGPARRSTARPAVPKAARPRSRRWPSAITTIGDSGDEGYPESRPRDHHHRNRVQDYHRPDRSADRRRDRGACYLRRGQAAGGSQGMTGITSLTDKDRIFTNVYGFQGPDLKSAQARGDWDKTADLMKVGQDAIIEAVKASGLRGRGGAGFPTGLKWRFVDKKSPKPKYICCNADESEPGTFKDHLLMERNPHLLFEGCL